MSAPCAACLRAEAERKARPDRVRTLERELLAARAALKIYANGAGDGGRAARDALGISHEQNTACLPALDNDAEGRAAPPATIYGYRRG